MKFYILLLLSILIFNSDASKELNLLNLVQVNLSNIAYKQLRIVKGNILSAPPLAILDVSLLSKYQCYKNIRTNLWSLGIPIIFWNDKYMQNITKSINKNNPLKKFSNNETFILPPSGIKAYRLNWKRFLNNVDNNQILLDSSWYIAKTDFVLPMWQTFLMEINSGNDSKSKCAEIKTALLNESLQTFELSIDFLIGDMKRLLQTDIEIKIKDLISVKEYKESNCEAKREQCYVSKDFAEMWAYDVSAKVMTNVNGSNLNLQKQIFDAVFDYLCKEKVSIDLVSVRKLKNNEENEKACKIPTQIIYKSNCRDYNRNNGYYGSNYEEKCRNENERITTISSDIISEDNVKFSIPISVI